jgi:hypothetical protein
VPEAVELKSASVCADVPVKVSTPDEVEVNAERV